MKFNHNVFSKILKNINVFLVWFYKENRKRPSSLPFFIEILNFPEKKYSSIKVKFSKGFGIVNYSVLKKLK